MRELWCESIVYKCLLSYKYTPVVEKAAVLIHQRRLDVEDKHVEAIQRVQNKFVRRTSFRCMIPRDTDELRLHPISEIHDAADLRMYDRLRRLDVADEFFDIRDNNLRSGANVNARQIAKTDRVNNMFSWRLVNKDAKGYTVIKQ